MKYKQPLSVFFVYHPSDYNNHDYLKESIDFCYKALQRDEKKPFSRFINIPVFYNTSLDKNIPIKINSQSQKTIVFLLISKYIIADDNWKKYYQELFQNSALNTIPVAIDETAINFDTCSEYNFIRADKFDKSFYKDEFLLNIAHEIYKWFCNETVQKSGKEQSINVFLSHTKEDELGEKIAIQIKEFIDKTQIKRFFDTTDIGINFKFEEEIKKHLQNSTLLAIHSDPYSSRYWCQKEILCAKEMDRPIVALDCLSVYEDRRFPHASNIAAIHLDTTSTNKIEEKFLYQIVEYLLLETLRYCYSKKLLKAYQEAKLLPTGAVLLSRPPEFIDINKVVEYDGNTYRHKSENFIYPEPIVYEPELEYFKKFGISASTPVNCNTIELEGMNIGLSISNLEDNVLKSLGQFSEHLIHLAQDFARYLLAAKAKLIYGGDLRKGGFTEFIFNEALILQSRLNDNMQHIENYIAYPIYNAKDDELVEWKAKYNKIAIMHSVPPADDVAKSVEEDEFIGFNTTHNKYIWSRSLTNMRNLMIDNCNVRICAGGRSSNYKGIMPGVLEEILIAIEKKKPLFLLGGFGGITSDICKLIKNNEVPESLTLNWQKQNNIGYEDLLKYYREKGVSVPDYDRLKEQLTYDKLNNGLEKEENERLFDTPYIEEAICLVMKGLNNLRDTKNRG